MAGCRVVFHAAGVNAMCLPDPAPMYRANVDGPAGVVRAAAAAGVPRVVHTSSAVTMGEAAGVVATEATPHRGSHLSHYERSKHLGEQAVLAEGARTGVEVVCVNPASVQGPGRTGGTARLLIGYLSGRLRWTVDATFSLVFVDDCTRAHLLAERRGVPGERYLVSGATLTRAGSGGPAGSGGRGGAAGALPAGLDRRGRGGGGGRGLAPGGAAGPGVPGDGPGAAPRRRLRRVEGHPGPGPGVHPAGGLAPGDRGVVPGGLPPPRRWRPLGAW